MINKWIGSILFFIMLIFPLTCPAGYQIKLKDGLSFNTETYWEEDGKIKFSHLGGVVGIPKEKIIDIKDSDAPVSEGIVSNPEPKEPNDPEFQKKETELKEAMWRIQDARITQTQYFNTAKKKKDQAGINTGWKNLIDLNQKMLQLRQKVADLYNGQLPEWWKDNME